MNLHCSQVLCLQSSSVSIWVNQLEGLKQSRPGSCLFRSVVQQKKAVKLCQQLYTTSKVLRLKNMCSYYLVVILSTASSFAAFNNFRPWNDGASSVLNWLSKDNWPAWYTKEQLLAENGFILCISALFSYRCMGKAFCSWSLHGESI